MLDWSLEEKELDLKFTWKISKASTSKKINYFIHVSDGDFKATGEVAGITTQEAHERIIPNEFKNVDFTKIQSPEDVYTMNLSSPLSFGIESALTHLECLKKNCSVSQYFNIEEPKKIPTSFSIPIIPVDEIDSFIEKNNIKNFPACKVKVGYEHQSETCIEVAKHFKGPIRIDANEAFKSAQDVLHFLDKIKGLNIEFLEQPMPRNLSQEYKTLKPQSWVPIIADESLQNQAVDSNLAEQFHGINIKLMKTGGYVKALEQIQQAKNLNLKIMFGCMVETSLGIHSAFTIGQDVDWFDLDGFLFFKDEPFQLIKLKDGYLYSTK